MTHKLSDDRLDELQEEVADHDNGWVAPSEFISILTELRTARRAAKKIQVLLDVTVGTTGESDILSRILHVKSDPDVKEFLK